MMKRSSNLFLAVAVSVLGLLLGVPGRQHQVVEAIETTVEASPPVSRCGDCWCIPNVVGATEGECPAFEEDLYYNVPLPKKITDLYRSWNLVVSPPESVAQTKSLLRSQQQQQQQPSQLPLLDECYPYPHLGVLPILPQSSQLPACQVGPSSPGDGDDDNAVCAFKFASTITNSRDCCGRDYELKTYYYANNSGVGDDGDSLMLDEDEDDDSAEIMVTHRGPCGVCSNARDFAVIASNPDLDKIGTKCGSAYYVAVSISRKDPSEAFESLVDCYKEEAGYTEQCARLWAYDTAAVSTMCLATCQGSSQQSYNGDPPLCELSDCLQCKEDLTKVEFTKLAGRTHLNSGLTQKMARPCSDFAAAASTISGHADPWYLCDGYDIPADCDEDYSKANETKTTDGGKRTAATDGAASTLISLLVAVGFSAFM